MPRRALISVYDKEELRRVFNLGIGWCAVVTAAEPGESVIGRIR